MSSHRSPAQALLLTATALMLCSAVWFSGTAVAPRLAQEWGLSPAHGAWLTLSVQLGFIVGTFSYAVLSLPDVFNPRWVFFWSALAGCLANALFAWSADGLGLGLVLRFLTGFTLAGIYPVSMKMIATWFNRRLGWQLGLLIGALTLGKSLSYLVQALALDISWRAVVATSSVCSLVGGALVLLLLTDGPYLSKRAPFDPAAMGRAFAVPNFRFAAYGYFGHMWELYAFWALCYYYISQRLDSETSTGQRQLLVFLTFGAGALGCLLAGWLSRRYGEKTVALAALSASGALCAASGVLFYLPTILFIGVLFVWGGVVIADSGQFSALAARYCPPEYTGTALTVQNGIGFSVTLFSIQLVSCFGGEFGWQWAFCLLTIGPLVGIYYTRKIEERA